MRMFSGWSKEKRMSPENAFVVGTPLGSFAPGSPELVLRAVRGPGCRHPVVPQVET
jgi:hypothetical protein